MNDKPLQDKEHITRLAVSTVEAAHALSISRQHLYSLFNAGDLRSFKSGRRRLVRLAELERYITERETCALA